MDPIQRIVVPIDLSDCAESVVEHALRVAKPLGAALHLVHAIERPAGLSRKVLVEGDDGEMKSLDISLHDAAANRLPRYVRQAREAGVEADSRIVEGAPAQVVLQLAKELPADLIVMGTHGRTGLQRLVVGSVAESVLRRADVPVLTVRATHKAHCEARSCQTCRSGVTDAMLQAEADLQG